MVSNSVADNIWVFRHSFIVGSQIYEISKEFEAG